MINDSLAFIRKLFRKNEPSSLQIPLGQINFGDLRQLGPLFPHYESARELAVDEHYINCFLEQEAPSINGRILASGFSARQATKTNNVVEAIHESYLQRMVDLPFEDEKTFMKALENLEANTFDSIVLVQQLQCVYEIHRVFRRLHRALKPGGKLLATVPGVCNPRIKNENFPAYRTFTTLSLRKLAEADFPEKEISVSAHGNVLAATAFAHGIPVNELNTSTLADHDAQYPLIITLTAEKERG